MTSLKRFANSMAGLGIRPAASPAGCARLNGPSRHNRERAMKDVKLPRHVINGVERRWLKKLEQAACAWRSERPAAGHARTIAGVGRRDIPVVIRRARKRSANPGRHLPPWLGEAR